MRALFLLLIVINAAYFAWQALYPSEKEHPPGIAAPAPGPTTGTLTLLSEAAEATSAAPGPTAATSDDAQAEPASPIQDSSPSVSAQDDDESAPMQPVCYRISGIEKKTEADILTAALQQRGALLSGRGANQVNRRNYWVMIPPFASGNAARDVVSELQRHGLDDFYLVRGGEYENAISLGVFSTESAALRRLESIRALPLSGPGPRLDTLELTAKRYWIAVQWPDNEKSEWEELIPDNAEIDVASTTCRSPR